MFAYVFILKIKYLEILSPVYLSLSIKHGTLRSFVSPNPSSPEELFPYFSKTSNIIDISQKDIR